MNGDVPRYNQVPKHIAAVVGVTQENGVRIKFILFDLPKSDVTKGRLTFFINATSLVGSFAFEWQCTQLMANDPAVTAMVKDAATTVYNHLVERGKRS